MKLLKVILCAVLVIALALSASLMVFAVQSISETKEQLQTYEAENHVVLIDEPAVLTTPTPVPVVSKTSSADHPFEDVAADSWYNDAVAYVYQNRFMSGTSVTTFAPDSNMTRAMLVTVLYRLAGSPNFEGSNPFEDVAASDWYCGPVVWAYTNGIVAGTSETTFAPDNNITREQMVAIFAKYAAYKGLEPAANINLDGYNDVNAISGYAVNAFKWAVDAGIISGTSATTLSPQGTATRAQCAVIMRQFERWVSEQDAEVTPVPTAEPTPTVEPTPIIPPTQKPEIIPGENETPGGGGL